MLAFVLNYVVYIGPAVMAGILLGVGLATWDSPPAIFLPMAAFLSLNMIEAQFVTTPGDRAFGHVEPFPGFSVPGVLDLAVGTGRRLACRSVTC